METISRDEYKNRYGQQALDAFGSAPSQNSNIKDFGLGFAKGIGDTVTETANMFVEGGRMIQAGLNPNETYSESVERRDQATLNQPAWVDPFSGEAEGSRRDILESDNNAQFAGKVGAFGAELVSPAALSSKGRAAIEMVRKSMRPTQKPDTPPSRERFASFVNKTRLQLSDIDPQYETVLKNQQNPDKVMAYFDMAEAAAQDPSKPMATTIASKRAIEAYEAIGRGLDTSGQMKGSLLDSIADVQIGGNIPGRSIDDIKATINQRYGLTIDNKGIMTPASGRIVSIDDKSQKLISEYITELRQLGVKPTARQLDDFVDRQQRKLYKQSSPNLFEVADEPVIAYLKSVTGNINSQLKHNVDGVLEAQGKDPSYSALNDQYKLLIEAQGDLNKALGDEGDKGAALMKSLFSPQTGERTRRIFQTVKDETGIDLFEEATLAKFAMETAGDTRSQSLLKQIDSAAENARRFNLAEPGSWWDSIKEAADLDGRDLAEEIIKQSSDEVAESVSKTSDSQSVLDRIRNLVS